MTRFAIARWAVTDGAGPVRVVDAGSIVEAPPAPSAFRFAPAERRRLNPLTAMALATVEAAVDPAWRERLGDVPIVFASAEGDGDVLIRLLEAISRAEPVSPTQFHNSVHNAAAGYWSIGLKSQTAGTAIAAGDETWAVALGEAGLQAVCSNGPVAVVFAERAFPQGLSPASPDLVSGSVAAWCEPLSRRRVWTCELQSRTEPGDRDGAELASAFRSEHPDGVEGRYRVRRLGATLQIARPRDDD